MKDWPHAPIHRLGEAGAYLVTAGTYLKEHCFRSDDRLDFLEEALLRLAKQYEWQLEAWAVFSNHHHFIGQSPPQPDTLNKFLRHLHADTARHANRLDNQPGRKIWHNFYETELTFEKSYLARLNYVHQNPVKHGLVAAANQYKWCSAAWFERTAPAAMVKSIYGFKTDQVNIPDDF